MVMKKGIMEMKEIKDYVINWHDTNSEVFYETASALWNEPELGMHEYKSSKRISDLLEDFGFTVKTGVANMPTAFIAEWGEGKPVIGFSVEYDALPGLSQKLSHKKEPIVEGDPGQGCGHNIIGVASAKAAIGLKAAMEKGEYSGTIKVFGTPAEELCIGKPFMAKEGLFAGVDVFLDWHPKYSNRVFAEKCSAYFNVKYHFKGKSCHGGLPWKGRSAFDAAMMQGNLVEGIREHMYPGEPPEAANTINYVFSTDGFSYPNVVPDSVTAWYIGRFTSSEDLLNALKRVDKCAEAAAMASETEVEREFITASHEKISNEVISKVLFNNLEEIGAPIFSEEEQNFAKKIQETLGVEKTGLDESIEEFKEVWAPLQDTSEYTWFAPYAILRLTMAPNNVGWHNWAVAACAGSSIALKTLNTAAKILTATAVDLLENPEIIEDAKREWREKLEKREYVQLIPEDMKPVI